MPAPLNLEEIRKSLGDRYAIERELGRGGMGAVYLARDVRLDRQVALKVLPPELAGDASIRERFLRETRTAASFSHPNIVPVHEVVERDGVLAFAMGYVEGESLAARVHRAGPLDVRGIVKMLQDIGYALAYAHGRGVIHRDIKPDNIMLDRASGRALLMDFGISRTMAAPASATQGLTRVGEVVGTPEFMSPEQATGDTLDGRTDLYSLGLVALYALTGTKPITGTSAQQILTKQLTELPPPASSLRADIPASLGAAIDKCVAKEPSQRFTTAEALVEAIDAAQVSTSEIPLQVRLFAQELATVSLVLLFLVAMTPLLTRGMSTGGNLDALIPIIMISAVAITRVAQTFISSRRLVEAGFQPEEVLKGMEAVVAERTSMIEVYRADPAMRRRRRKTLMVAALFVIIAALLIVITRERAVETRPHTYSVGISGMIMGIIAVVLFGVAFMLAMRSPFRPPPADRIFRRLWLGPIGRAFIRLSARGVAQRGGAGLRTPGATPAQSARAPAGATPSATPPPSLDQLALLEARLAALEKERDTKP